MIVNNILVTLSTYLRVVLSINDLFNQLYIMINSRCLYSNYFLFSLFCLQTVSVHASILHKVLINNCYMIFSYSFRQVHTKSIVGNIIQI